MNREEKKSGLYHRYLLKHNSIQGLPAGLGHFLYYLGKWESQICAYKRNQGFILASDVYLNNYRACTFL